MNKPWTELGERIPHCDSIKVTGKKNEDYAQSLFLGLVVTPFWAPTVIWDAVKRDVKGLFVHGMTLACGLVICPLLVLAMMTAGILGYVRYSPSRLTLHKDSGSKR